MLTTCMWYNVQVSVFNFMYETVVVQLLYVANNDMYKLLSVDSHSELPINKYLKVYINFLPWILKFAIDQKFLLR